MVSRGWACCGVLGLAALAQSRGALADNSRPFALDYEVAPECPERAAAVAGILKRDGRLVESERAPAGRHFRIVVEARGRRFAGRLEQPEQGAVRQVAGSDCAKVVEALSLVLVFAASARGEGGLEPVNGDAETVDAEGDDPSEPEPAAPARPAQGQREPRRAAVATPEGPAASGSARAPELAWALGAGGVSVWGSAPVLLAGPAVTLERSHDRGWLFVRLVGRLAYGIGAPSNWLGELVPQLGFRASLGTLEVAVQAGLGFGVLALERDTGASNLWVTPFLGPTLRIRPSPQWWFELGAEVGIPLVERRIRLAASSGTTGTENMVIGAGIFGGFGKVTERRIGSGASGHSLDQ